MLPILLADLFQMLGLTVAGDRVSDAIPQADKDDIIAKGWETVIWCLALVPFVIAITYAALLQWLLRRHYRPPQLARKLFISFYSPRNGIPHQRQTRRYFGPNDG